MRTRVFVLLISVISFLAVAPFAGADSVDPATPLATQALVDFGSPTVNTGNINTSTIFNIEDLVSTGNNSGALAGFPSSSFGPVSFNVNSPTSFTFGNSIFGIFRSTSITQTASTPGFTHFVISGNWTPGTFSGLTGQGPFVAEVGVSFNQLPPVTGIISDNAVLSVSRTVIPEPSTFLMGLTGISPAVVLFRFRRRRCHIETA